MVDNSENFEQGSAKSQGSSQPHFRVISGVNFAQPVIADFVNELDNECLVGEKRLQVDVNVKTTEAGDKGVKEEEKSTGSVSKKPGSEVDFDDLGEENSVVEDSEEEDAEECEQDVSWNTISDSQAPFPLVDYIQIDKVKFSVW
ncbi:hypothetical protein U1Q18_022540 [Sarracenia purpurea var. burkii]